jgi:O-antigen/teichoic acid export membrane protein
MIRSVLLLATGTLLAQVINILCAPILTRIFSPSDFGLVALFLGIVGCFSPAICGKYEVAVVVARSESESKQLVGVCFIAAFVLSLLIFILIILFEEQIKLLLNATSLKYWLLFVPISLLSSGIIVALNSYSNHLNDYKTIAHSKVLGSIFGVLVSISFGLSGVNYGLLLSAIIAPLTVVCWLFYRCRAIRKKTIFQWSPRKKLLIKRYRDFPIYNASSALLDGLTLSLPIFFFSRYYSEATVGHYALTLRVAMAPLAFISDAVSQVNLRKVSELLGHDREITPYLLKTTLFLLAFVIPLMMLLIFYASEIFVFIFGGEWQDAGEFLSILMPAIALKFVVSTLSSTFGATGNNQLGAVWKITAFVISLSVYTIFCPVMEIKNMLMIILITDIVLYIFYYLLILRSAAHPRRY